VKQIDKSRILWENPACLVVNKLPGETAGDEEAFPRAVHRLDVPVSGCVLCAKTPKALAFLSGLFREGPSSQAGGAGAGSVRKLYWAVTEAPGEDAPPPPEGELSQWITWDKARNKSRAWDKKMPGALEARLRCRVAGRGERYLFMEIELLTGRHHQIRAQLASRGIHIKGDLKYGARRSEKAGGIRLHARSLSFPNPLSKEELITVIAPPPLYDRLWAAFPGCGGAGEGPLLRKDL